MEAKNKLTTEQKKKIVRRINDIYNDFELKLESLRKKRKKLIDQVIKEIDEKKIQKTLNKLKK